MTPSTPSRGTVPGGSRAVQMSEAPRANAPKLRGRVCPPRAVELSQSWASFNALNYERRSGADSTDCAERTEERTGWTERTGRVDSSHDLAKVSVAGSNPVVRSRSSGPFPGRSNAFSAHDVHGVAHDVTVAAGVTSRGDADPMNGSIRQRSVGSWELRLPPAGPPPRLDNPRQVRPRRPRRRRPSRLHPLARHAGLRLAERLPPSRPTACSRPAPPRPSTSATRSIDRNGGVIVGRIIGHYPEHWTASTARPWRKPRLSGTREHQRPGDPGHGPRDSWVLVSDASDAAGSDDRASSEGGQAPGGQA